MKYLVSPIQLGQLLQEDDKLKRDEIIEEILNLYYIVDTSDNLKLHDHVEINKIRRKELRKKLTHRK